MHIITVHGHFSAVQRKAKGKGGIDMLTISAPARIQIAQMLANAQDVGGVFFRPGPPSITEHKIPGKAPRYSVDMLPHDWTALCEGYAVEVDYEDMMDAATAVQQHGEYSDFLLYLAKLPCVADFVFGPSLEYLSILPPLMPGDPVEVARTASRAIQEHEEAHGGNYAQERAAAHGERRVEQKRWGRSFTNPKDRRSEQPRRISVEHVQVKIDGDTTTALEDSEPCDVPGAEGAGHPHEGPFEGEPVRGRPLA